tara:strand:- start:55 stop:822 length:768 start_codon:yes stop_codon:yes gene_type:complete
MFLIVLSPAKTLDFERKLNCKKSTIPSFLQESKNLINYLLKMKKEEIGKLMSISQKLTDLNYERYRSWSEDFNITNSRHAISCFTGDVYKGLDVNSFSSDDLNYSQHHLRILSGLYGVLRPLDLMKPYRLEMGVKLKTERGKNLYDFWENKITENLNQNLSDNNNQYLINLASNEYFDSVHKNKLIKKVITPKFLDEKNGVYKVISFFAKKARGSMASYIIKNKIETLEGLQKFDGLKYRFSSERSDESNFVFIR